MLAGGLASEPKTGVFEESSIQLVTYDDLDEEEGSEEVDHILKSLKEGIAVKEPQPTLVFQEEIHGYHALTMENDEPIDTEDERGYFLVLY